LYPTKKYNVYISYCVFLTNINTAISVQVRGGMYHCSNEHYTGYIFHFT
jgi:hypothetical protein